MLGLWDNLYKYSTFLANFLNFDFAYIHIFMCVYEYVHMHKIMCAYKFL